MPMELQSIRIGDYLWHGPTKVSGTVESIEDEPTGLLVQLNNGEGPYHITPEVFRLWWNVERNEDQIHWQAGSNKILKEEGRVVEVANA